jgi:hypothetical protein
VYLRALARVRADVVLRGESWPDVVAAAWAQAFEFGQAS